jgi:uncharacterized protein
MYVDGVFTLSNVMIGCVAALIVGLSKTAIPGGGLLATPLFAMVVSGRLIAGITLPVLVLADLFAMRWYGQHRRNDVLRPLVIPVVVGFVAGAAFFVVVGSGGRVLDVLIAVIVLMMVAIQSVRLIQAKDPVASTPSVAAAVGTTGGFTTFVANAAGPVVNTYFSGLGLSKLDLIGSSAVFYFVVNVSKVPVYLLLGWFSDGGSFFTAESLRFDAILVPAVLFGVFGGRWLLPRIPQRVFSIAVLVFAAVAAVRLLVG